MSNTIYFDHYAPDYESSCCNCGQSPVVTAVDENDKVVHTTEMCGPCTWGEAATIDPDTWN